jgi:glycosyltransferase involved in cell wall biosynthesis
MFVLLAFVFFLVVQLYFYAFVFGKYTGTASSPFLLPKSLKDPPTRSVDHLPGGVSVVVCAFNEADNLLSNLKSLAGQRYPDYEIILVDDGSTDETPRILKEFQDEFNSEKRPVRVLRIPPSDSHGKKYALSRGIEMARKENILLTDADCRPSSSHWIKKMVSGLEGASEIVLGYGAYRKIPGSLLNKLIRYETLMTALQYFSYALQGQAYMGVGRNLAYKKVLFEDAGGFKTHLDVRSGDDDLFVNEVATSKNTVICDHPDAFTISEPKGELSSWLRQKRRHITTSKHYKAKQKLKLGVFYLSQIGFYTGAIVLLSLNTAPKLVIGLILLRFLVFYYTMNRTAKKLHEKDLVTLAPLYEISIIFMQLYLFVANTFSPPKKW